MKAIQFAKCLFLLGSILSFTSCEREAENIFNMFEGVKVTFHDGGPYSVVENTVLNDGDSVRIYFTIASEHEDMFKVVVDSSTINGQPGERTILTKESERRSYSGVIKHKMKRDGKMTFRFFALNRLDNYIGDGYTSITVEGRPSYVHLPRRRLYDPEVGNAEKPSFYSIGEGVAYSYEEAQAHADKIDFAVYTIPDERQQHLDRLAYNFYSLDVEENPVPEFDISGWEKRATLFSAPIGGGRSTFEQVLISASAIEEEAKKRQINLKEIKTSEWDKALGPDNLVYFLTPEGKYGAIFVHQNTKDRDSKEYVSISTKMQK